MPGERLPRLFGVEYQLLPVEPAAHTRGATPVALQVEGSRRSQSQAHVRQSFRC